MKEIDGAERETNARDARGEMRLLTPVRIGRRELGNRIVMAPMARARCDENHVPTPMVAEYYAQRASAGLIVAEASSVSPRSCSRGQTAAIYLDSHAAGWRRVAKRVHEHGGSIFQQIYHLGRKSDPSRMPGRSRPVAPSAIAARGQIAGLDGPVDFAVPRALETEEVAAVVDEFRVAAMMARDAGMDGIEVHGANGFLIDQFLRDASNRRTDRYGGSVENRARFLLEVVDAVAGVFTADRVGVRLSPHFRADGISDSSPENTFGHAAAALSDRRIAYLHLVEAVVPDLPQSPPVGARPLIPVIRRAFGGPLIVNGGYTRETAEKAICSGLADLVAFATLYIGNPDLVHRFRRDGSLNGHDRATAHNGGAAGYIDYPGLVAEDPSARPVRKPEQAPG